MTTRRTPPGHIPKQTHDFAPTPFGTGCQSMDSYDGAIWEETLLNEQRQQMKDWATRNKGQNNPLDFNQNPLPAGMVTRSDPSKAPTSIPRDAPVDTKNPFQIRDPTFVIPGDPGAKPKFYAGRRSRKKSFELAGITAASIPGITHGMGGYRALAPEDQAKLMNYPPPNPLAKKSQSTAGFYAPGSTVFGFGSDYHRATRDAPLGQDGTQVRPQFRPPKLPGEISLKDF